MSEERGRPFTPGNTLGRGRPKGSRNRRGSPGQDLLDKYTTHLVSKCIDQAMKGSPTAMRLCMERIFPARRDASICMSLSPVRTAQDVNKAAGKVTREMGRGKITPTEGATMMDVLESHSRIIEKVDLESRLAKLEEKENVDAVEVEATGLQGDGK
jgi:hypothetical protein